MGTNSVAVVKASMETYPMMGTCPTLVNQNLLDILNWTGKILLVLHEISWTRKIWCRTSKIWFVFQGLQVLFGLPYLAHQTSANIKERKKIRNSLARKFTELVLLSSIPQTQGTEQLVSLLAHPLGYSIHPLQQDPMTIIDLHCPPGSFLPSKGHEA